MNLNAEKVARNGGVIPLESHSHQMRSALSACLALHNKAPAWWYGIVLGDSDDNSLASFLGMSKKELLDVLEVCGLVSWNSDRAVRVHAKCLSALNNNILI